MKTVKRALVSTVIAGLAVAAAQSAQAALIIDYRFSSSAADLSKNVGAGQDVTVHVFGTVTAAGIDGIALSEFRAQSLQLSGGGAFTTGGVTAAGFTPNPGIYDNTPLAPGLISDNNTDGLMDMGLATGVASNSDAKARAFVVNQAPAVGVGYYSNQAGWTSATGPNTSIELGTFVVHVGSIGAAGATTKYQLLLPTNSGAASWFENTTTQNGTGAKAPGVQSAVYSVGTSVTFVATGEAPPSTSVQATFNYALTTHNDATLGTIHSKSLTVVGSNKNYNDPTAADFVPADPIAADYAIANANLGVGGETPVLILVDFNLGSMTIADLRNALVSVGDVAPSSIFGPADADNTGQRALLLSQYPSFVDAETLMFKFDAVPGAVAGGLHFGFDLTGSGVSVNRTIAVPEPASVGLLALGAMSLMGRRRKMSR